MRYHRNTTRLLFTAGAILAALLPLARLTRILAITGVDVPSSDDIFFIPNVVGKVFAGGYNWTNFPRDSFQNTHVTIVPALAYLLMARFGHFNVYYALAFGVTATGVKLVLLYDAFTFRVRLDEFAGRAALFVLLSAMIFSVTQMSVFEHDFQALKTGFTELGLAMGVWGFARFQDRWPAVALACIGGLLASFSFANGMFLWPVFLLTLIAMGSRRITRYLVIVIAAAFAAAPYADFLRINRVAGGQSRLVSLFDVRFVLSAFGRPFSNDIGFKFEPRMGEIELGLVVVVVFTTALIVILRGRSRESFVRSVPALSVAMFSLLTILQISMFRGLVAPWYTTFAMDMWIGTAGLVYLLWAGPKGGGLFTLKRAIAALIAMVIAVFFAASNRSYSDKSFFLRTRAPASAASLRNYLTAPTYAMDTLEIWRPADPSHFSTLGPTLDRFNLSVFGPHQELTLQGDWVLDSVRFDGSHSGWSQGLSPKFVPFTDFRHLNLFIGAGESVYWTLTLPPSTVKATFESAAAVSGSCPANGVVREISVSIVDESGAVKPLSTLSPVPGGEWNPFSFPLCAYAGRKVTLRLSYTGQEGDGSFGVLRYPRIKVDQQPPSPLAWRWKPQAPSNTDLSPNFIGPVAGDFSSDPGAGTSWTIHDLKPVADEPGGHLWSVTGPDPYLEYDGPVSIDIDIDTHEYSSFFVKMHGPREQIPGVSYGGDLYPGGIRVDFKAEESAETAASFQMPIMYDSAEHTYSYPLWKFGISGKF
ncbi:MAG: hypothetical protein ACREAC_13445, partial [Blastocatellia bacterium]